MLSHFVVACFFVSLMTAFLPEVPSAFDGAFVEFADSVFILCGIASNQLECQRFPAGMLSRLGTKKSSSAAPPGDVGRSRAAAGTNGQGTEHYVPSTQPLSSAESTPEQASSRRIRATGSEASESKGQQGRDEGKAPTVFQPA